MYAITFRGGDNLPHRDEIRADSDRNAIAEARRLHPTGEWVLRRRRGPALEIVAESCPEEECA